MKKQTLFFALALLLGISFLSAISFANNITSEDKRQRVQENILSQKQNNKDGDKKEKKVKDRAIKQKKYFQNNQEIPEQTFERGVPGKIEIDYENPSDETRYNEEIYPPVSLDLEPGQTGTLELNIIRYKHMSK